MHICKPHLYGQDAVKPVQQSWNFCIVYKLLHRCFKCFCSRLRIWGNMLLILPACWGFSTAVCWTCTWMILSSKHKTHLCSQLSFSFTECTVKSLTIAGQSIVLNFHRRVEIACTGICPYWSCFALLHYKFRVLLTKRLAAISSFTQPSLAWSQLNAHLPILAMTLSCSMSCCF